MAKRKEEESFTVSDRRLFSTDGELRPEKETTEPSNEPKIGLVADEPQPDTLRGVENPSLETEPPAEAPPPPTAEQQSAQADAYSQTNRSMDEAISKEMGPGVADLEVTFERFLGSLYMTALMQLGLAHEPNGQPRLDIISARQTIDTVALLADKTKGNLSSTEQSFLQNALYELRMAYLEVTNALARAPRPAAPGAGGPSVAAGSLGSGPLIR
jgi:Domain of unknown function (DUF1844)